MKHSVHKAPTNAGCGIRQFNSPNLASRESISMTLNLVSQVHEGAVPELDNDSQDLYQAYLAPSV